MILKSSEGWLWAAQRGSSGSSWSKSMEKPKVCSCLVTFLPFFALPFLLAFISKQSLLQPALVNYTHSNLPMRPAHSKSQLQPPRQKTSEVTTQTQQAKRRKSQLADNPSREDCAKGPTRRRGEGKDLIQAKNQQLFGIIETFYSTLCSLPMEMLINSADPQFWLSEQQATLKELFRKLQGMSRDKDYDYYNWKLESVSKLLQNIAQNLGMLRKITQLKGYFSGTESSQYRSRNSSALDSEQEEPRVPRFPAQISDQVSEPKKQMKTYDRYEIGSQKVPERSAKSNHCSELMAETLQSDQQMSQEETVPLAHSEVYPKQQTKRRLIQRQGQNIDTLNLKGKPSNPASWRRQQAEIQSKDKTLAKLPFSKGGRSSRTLGNENASERFLEDRVQGSTDGQRNQSKEWTKDGFPEDLSKEQNTVQSMVRSPQADGKQEYVEMIKQLRLDLLSKDRQIERLLIGEQEYEDGIQIFRSREKQKNTEILFLKENIVNSNKERQKLQAQIRTMMEYQEELKETIRFERDRNKRETREKEEIEQKFYEEALTKEQLTGEVARLKVENRELKRNERVAKEKLEVYKKKYFTVYGELQHAKERAQLLEQEVKSYRLERMQGSSPYDEVKLVLEKQKERLCDESF